jgi:PAS domain S-box-containing protein
MNYQDKTKDELINELCKLQQECNSLKASYIKDISECKKAEEILSQQNDALSKLNSFSIGLSKLTLEDNLEAFIAKQLKSISGAEVAIFSEYNQTNRTITAKHIEVEPDLLEKVNNLLGKQITRIHSEVSDELYREMTSEIIGVRKTLTGATFGAIQRPMGAAIQALLRADRFIGLAYIVEGKLYGTSLLAMSRDHPDPPREILENFIFLAAVSLRRKQVEELLKESTERLNEAQKLAHIGVWDWKPDTDTVTWAEELYHIAGLDPILTAPTYKEHSDLYTPKSWELLKTSVDKAMETGESYQLELELIRPNGDIRIVNAFGGAKFDSKGQVDGLFGTVQDITERKQIEKELQIQGEIMKNISEGINLTRVEDEIIVFTNPKFDYMFGYKPGELIGKHVSILNAPTSKTPEETKQDVVDIMNKSGEWRGEILNIKKNGDHFWCYATISVFDHPDYGKMFLAIHSDITERKRVQEELRKSKELFEKTFSSQQDAIFILDAKTPPTIINCNPVTMEIFGYTGQEMLGLTTSFLHVDEIALRMFQERLQSAIAERGFLHMPEFEMRRKDGTIFATGHSVIPLKDEKGNRIGWVSIIRDITERKQAEATLRESEAKFRSLFENSLVAISTASPDGKLLQANLAYAQMYGYENPEMMKAEVNDVGMLFGNPEERKEVLQILRKKGLMEARELELIRRNGSRFFALVSACEIRDSEGKLFFNMATHIDLTDRKKDEETIRAASLYSRNLIEASLDPLVTINAEGRVTDVNIATEQITGIKREKLIGSDFADYFTEPDKARKGYRIVFSKGVVKDYPLTILHKNGRKIDVLYNATIFKNEAGEVQGVFAAARDITELKKMETELRTSKKLLEELNNHLQDIRENERAQIAINLHDDIGQKLTSLNLNIVWLKSRIGVQSKVVKEKLEEMTLMIKETIDGVQDFSSNLRPAILFDLGPVSAFDSYLKKFEKQSGIKCLFYHDKDEFNLENNISLILYRILQEAMTNIARHSEATISEVTLRQAKNKIEMLIKDNGIGIDAEKVNAPTSMGIAGMKERIKSIRGNLIIKGKKGSWTFVKVSVPIKIGKKDDKSINHR